MTFEELLKSLGIEDETVKKVTDGMKEHKIYLSSEENSDIIMKKLKDDLEVKDKELITANDLIADLKKNAGDNEELKNKVHTYESDISKLQADLTKTRTDSAVRMALVKAGAKDPDYLMYKLKADNTELKLDDSGNLTGVNDIITGLKGKHESQFGEKQKVIENPLQGGNSGGEPKIKSMADALKATYEKGTE